MVYSLVYTASAVNENLYRSKTIASAKNRNLYRSKTIATLLLAVLKQCAFKRVFAHTLSFPEHAYSRTASLAQQMVGFGPAGVVGICSLGNH